MTTDCNDVLYCDAGSAWRLVFEYVDLAEFDANGEPIAGDPIPLTGIAARLDVRDQQGDTLFTASTENGKLSIDADDGQITLQATASDTAPFATSAPRELAVALRIWIDGDYDASAETIAKYTLVASPSAVGGAA